MVKLFLKVTTICVRTVESVSIDGDYNQYRNGDGGISNFLILILILRKNADARAIQYHFLLMYDAVFISKKENAIVGISTFESYRYDLKSKNRHTENKKTTRKQFEHCVRLTRKTSKN